MCVSAAPAVRCNAIGSAFRHLPGAANALASCEKCAVVNTTAGRGHKLGRGILCGTYRSSGVRKW